MREGRKESPKQRTTQRELGRKDERKRGIY